MRWTILSEDLDSRDRAVFSESLLHMFSRCKKNNDHVVVFVTRKSANVGMVIAKSRMAMTREAHQHRGADPAQRLEILLEAAENARLTGTTQPPFDQPSESWRALALGSAGAAGRRELRLRPAFGR